MNQLKTNLSSILNYTHKTDKFSQMDKSSPINSVSDTEFVPSINLATVSQCFAELNYTSKLSIFHVFCDSH